MKNMIFLFFVLLALPVAFPLSCTEHVSRTMAVPALRDDGAGSLVNISVSIMPGSGNIFSSTSPVVGPATQKSQRTASEYAAQLSGFNISTCDFMFSIGSSEVGNVDGPSAGAAMALLVSSALKNESIRWDFTATGTIEADGRVGPVGGLVEKSHAAESGGLSLIALPLLEPSEKIVFYMIQNYSNSTFVEVQDFPMLEAIATGEGPVYYAILPPEPQVRLYPPPLPEKSWRHSGDFDAVAGEFISGAYGKVASASTTPFSAYLQKEIEDALKINSLGYSYAAANIAFLAGIDADLVSTSRAQVPEVMASARECVVRNIGIKPSSSDWEWGAAAQMRLSWATKKLGEAEARQASWEGDEVLSLKDAIQARAWCEAAESILSRAASSEPADQSKMRPIAERYITQAEELQESIGNTESGLSWHIETAKQSYSRGEYVAAAYDALYGLSFSSVPSSVSDYDEVVSAMDSTYFTSAWGGTYSSQAKYTLESGGDPVSVFQLSLYAIYLENSTSEMMQAQQAAPESGRQSDDSVAFLIMLLLAIAIFSVHQLVQSFPRAKS